MAISGDEMSTRPNVRISLQFNVSFLMPLKFFIIRRSIMFDEVV